MSRPGWLVPVVVLALAFAASAGIAARGFYQSRSQPAATQTVPQQVVMGTPSDDTTVRLSPDALAHPNHEAVRRVLQTYFDAINNKDRDAWVSVVAPARAAEKTTSVFQADYASTRDSDAYVYRISSTGRGKLQVLLRFASRQRPDAAPQDAHRGCLWWRAAYGLVSDNGWRLDDEGTTARYQACLPR